MKKILSVALAFLFILSVGVTAFAASSPSPAPVPAPIGGGGEVAKKSSEFEIADSNGSDKTTIPAEAVKTVAIDKVDSLSAEDAEAFKAAYEKIKDLKDGKVYKFFWLSIDSDVAGDSFDGLDDDDALVYKFTCPGENVKVTVNGKDMKVESLGNNKYKAFLTETGAVAIITD